MVHQAITGSVLLMVPRSQLRDTISRPGILGIFGFYSVWIIDLGSLWLLPGTC